MRLDFCSNTFLDEIFSSFIGPDYVFMCVGQMLEVHKLASKVLETSLHLTRTPELNQNPNKSKKLWHV